MWLLLVSMIPSCDWRKIHSTPVGMVQVLAPICLLVGALGVWGRPTILTLSLFPVFWCSSFWGFANLQKMGPSQNKLIPRDSKQLNFNDKPTNLEPTLYPLPLYTALILSATIHLP